MPRLFTAIEIAPDAALSLSFLRGGLPGARWIEPENYHLTLRFIGDVDARTADEIVAHLDRIECAPFQIALNGLSSFGSRKPHSVYARVEPARELEVLQAEIDKGLRRLGLKDDARRFVPHVTLARLRNAKADDIAHYLSMRGGFRTPAFQALRFGLFSSRDSVGGGPYVLEEAFPLRARAPSAGLAPREPSPGRGAAILSGSPRLSA